MRLRPEALSQYRLYVVVTSAGGRGVHGDLDAVAELPDVDLADGQPEFGIDNRDARRGEQLGGVARKLRRVPSSSRPS